MNLIKLAQNKEYLTNLGIDPDISDALLLYLDSLKGSKKQKYIVSKLRKNVDKINSIKGELLSDPNNIDALFPFKYRDSISKVMDESQVDKEMAEWALSINTKYSSWIAKLLKNNTVIQGEDDLKIKERLEEFEQLLNSPNFPKNLRDINRYETFGALAKIVEENSDNKSKSQTFKDQAVAGSRKVYDDGKIVVLKITTPEAGATLCKGTDWCVKDPKYGRDYLDDGPIYLFYINGDRSVLVHTHSTHIKDIYDDPLTDHQVIKEISPVIDKLDLNIFWGDFDGFNVHGFDPDSNDVDKFNDFNYFNRISWEIKEFNEKVEKAGDDFESYVFSFHDKVDLLYSKTSSEDIEKLKYIMKQFDMLGQEDGDYYNVYETFDALRQIKPKNVDFLRGKYYHVFTSLFYDILYSYGPSHSLKLAQDLDQIFEYTSLGPVKESDAYSDAFRLIKNAFFELNNKGKKELITDLIECVPYFDKVFNGEFKQDPEIIFLYGELAEKLLQEDHIESFNLLNETFDGLFTNKHGSELKTQLHDEENWYQTVDPHKYEREDFEELSYASADWYSSFKRTCSK
jgi:hypothetical protein